MPRKPRRIHIAPKHEHACTELEKVDIDVLQEMMLASGDQRFVSFGHALGDPLFKNRSLVQLCAMHGLGPKDVAAMYKEAQLAVGQIQQMRHAPNILESNAVAAIGLKVPCPTCKGRKVLVETCERCAGSGKIGKGPCAYCGELGVIEVGPCQTCAETGWIMKAGDNGAFKGFMESAGLTGKSGPLVNINQNFGAGGLEDFLREAERVIEVKPE